MFFMMGHNRGRASSRKPARKSPTPSKASCTALSFGLNDEVKCILDGYTSACFYASSQRLTVDLSGKSDGFMRVQSRLVIPFKSAERITAVESAPNRVELTVLMRSGEAPFEQSMITGGFGPRARRMGLNAWTDAGPTASPVAVAAATHRIVRVSLQRASGWPTFRAWCSAVKSALAVPADTPWPSTDAELRHQPRVPRAKKTMASASAAAATSATSASTSSASSASSVSAAKKKGVDAEKPAADNKKAVAGRKRGSADPDFVPSDAEDDDASAMPAKKRRTVAKKTPAKKTPAKKTPAKKAPAKKAAAKKTPAATKCGCRQGCNSGRCKCRKERSGCSSSCACSKTGGCSNLWGQWDIPGALMSDDCFADALQSGKWASQADLDAYLDRPLMPLLTPYGLDEDLPDNLKAKDNATLRDLVAAPQTGMWIMVEWSFCGDTPEGEGRKRHCAKCHHCTDRRDEHCNRCNKCYFAGTMGSFPCPCWNRRGGGGGGRRRGGGDGCPVQ